MLKFDLDDLSMISLQNLRDLAVEKIKEKSSNEYPFIEMGKFGNLSAIYPLKYCISRSTL